MKLLCDTPSVHPPPIHSQSTAVETETPGLQSQTGEGDLSEENPSLGRVEDRGLDLEASGNNPLNPGFNSNLARFYEVIRDDDNPKEADIHHKADMGKQIEPFQGLQPYTILYPPLQRSSLSPLATEFIPTTPNSFAVLFNPGHASETSLDPIPLEDPLVNLYERNMALYNNAIEDLPHERDEPLLYTHSDGEDKVFIDYKLKPLQIDTSRCSKTPLLLGRVFKGRKTYSPSQVVTRSKARLLAEGRKKSPLGWFEDPDEPANTFANEIIQAFKQSCPVKKEVTPKQPLTRSQKKKAKKKLKLAKVVEQNWDDYEDDYL
ncbi:unnamed protein product [Cuscuta campestris]|uniref:Uncharacterized protein n=1 Tax=Cuscuta campestris TaxID=132261 RepID=A0A484ND05_9ASTE|nr:unnamed protein product [Cuscuta campestris]